MRAVVVYESVFGNTHRIAEAVAEGLRQEIGDVTVLMPDVVTDTSIEGTDLVVVGGPTHVHGMARPSTKHDGVEQAEKAGSDVDEQAYGETLRHWFDGIGRHEGEAAAFDTRFDASKLITGQASHGIRKRLRRHGWTVSTEPESFIVDGENELLDGELDRARDWGAGLARSFVTRHATD